MSINNLFVPNNYILYCDTLNSNDINSNDINVSNILKTDTLDPLSQPQNLITVNGDMLINGDLTADNINILNILTNLIPAVDNFYNIGSSLKRWADLYVIGNSYLQNITTQAGNLSINPVGEIDINSKDILNGGIINAAQLITTDISSPPLTDLLLNPSGSAVNFNNKDLNNVGNILSGGDITITPFGGDLIINGRIQVNNLTNQIVLGTTPNLTTINSPAPAGAITLTLPITTDTLIGRNTIDTLTNKTLTSPSMSNPTITGTAQVITLNRTSGDLTIQTTTSGNVRLNPIGCVSCGLNTNTSYALCITGRNANNDAVRFFNTTNTAIWQFSFPTDNFNIGESGVADNRIYIHKGGNVSIGNTTNTHRLDVSGTIRGTTYTGTATTNQLILGTTNTTTISAPAPASPITLTLPNTADTIVGRATTDTLTNKTINSSTLGLTSRFTSQSLFTIGEIAYGSTPVSPTASEILNNVFVLGDAGGVGTVNLPSAANIITALAITAIDDNTSFYVTFTNPSIQNWTLNAGAGFTDNRYSNAINTLTTGLYLFRVISVGGNTMALYNAN